MIGTKCFSKALLLSLVCLCTSQSISAMHISPEVTGRVGVAGLCLGANVVGYVAHEILRVPDQDRNSDLQDSVLWGVRAAWITADIHLIPAIFSHKWPSTLIKRGGILAAASFGANAFAKYVYNKLNPSITDEHNVSNAIKQGTIYGVGATAALIDVAILYESLLSVVNFVTAHSKR